MWTRDCVHARMVWMRGLVFFRLRCVWMDCIRTLRWEENLPSTGTSSLIVSFFLGAISDASEWISRAHHHLTHVSSDLATPPSLYLRFVLDLVHPTWRLPVPNRPGQVWLLLGGRGMGSRQEGGRIPREKKPRGSWEPPGGGREGERERGGGRTRESWDGTPFSHPFGFVSFHPFQSGSTDGGLDHGIGGYGAPRLHHPKTVETRHNPEEPRHTTIDPTIPRQGTERKGP